MQEPRPRQVCCTHGRVPCLAAIVPRGCKQTPPLTMAQCNHAGQVEHACSSELALPTFAFQGIWLLAW